MIKRLFDLFISGTLLVLLSPLYLYLSQRIKRDSPGPATYRGLRTGKDGKNFYINKLRTMYENSDSFNGSRVTAKDDTRITPYGRWLRNTKMNELPQLWNVFKGEMSMVGPRPEDPQIVNEWPLDARKEILSVKPGITSPASVLYHDEEKLLSREKVMQIYLDDVLPSKLRLDQLYVRYRSFLGDLDILFYTLLVLVPRIQKTSPPEEQLLVGPIRNFINRNFSWFTVDTLITLVAIGIAGMLWRSLSPLNIGLRSALLFGIGFALIFSMVGAMFGMHRIYWSRSSILDSVYMLPAVVIATGITLFFNHYVLMRDPNDPYSVIISLWNNETLLPPLMILLAASFAFVGYVVVRYRERLITGLASRWIDWRGIANPAQERAIIVGGGETGYYISSLLTDGFYRKTVKIIGYVDDDLYKLNTRIDGINVIGKTTDIPHLVELHDIGLIIFTIHNIKPEKRQEILNICAGTDAHTVYFPDIAAALGQIAQHGHITHADWIKDADWISTKRSYPLDLPCQICLSKLSPSQVDSWLETLENDAKQGNIPKLLEQIKELRAQLNLELPVIPADEIPTR